MSDNGKQPAMDSKEFIEVKGFSRPIRVYEVNIDAETDRDAAA